MDTVLKKAVGNLQEKIDYMDRCYFADGIEAGEESFPGIVDDYFCECFGSSAAGPEIGILKNPYAIIALGGYGRGEFWSLPDLDLLFLFSRDVPEGAAALVREVVYPLWDMGWNVNYSLQTSREIAKLARKGFRTLTSLFDARFVCGVSTVYSDLSAFLRNTFFLHRSRSIGLNLVRIREKRVAAHGAPEYLLEPDLQKSPGGLMDLREMLWIARLRFNILDLEELKYSGFFSHDEVLLLKRAEVFIGGARKHLCYAGGKSLGRLYGDFQGAVSMGMGFTAAGGTTAREGLLTELSGWMALVSGFYTDLVHEAGLSDSKTVVGASTHYRWISVRKGRLAFSSSLKILGEPELLINIFEERCRLGVPLGREAKRLVREFAKLLEPSSEKLSTLIGLQKERCPVLDEMLEAGLLERFIPEFKGAENLVRIADHTPRPLHRHLFRTVSAVNEMEETLEDLPDGVFTGLRFRNVLTWAALLHDIGRVGATEDACENGLAVVGRLFKANGVDGCRYSLEELRFLMKNQWFLLRIATRRDIRDRGLIHAAGVRLRNPYRLKMLYILSVAHVLATGPGVWDAGLAENLKSLYLDIFKMMDRRVGENGAGPADCFPGGLPTEGEEVLEMIAANVPEGYLCELSRQFLLDHISFHQRIEQGRAKKEAFHWEIDRAGPPGTRRVVVGAAGGKELLSLIAGGLILNGIEIIRAGIYPLGGGVRLLIIRTKEPVDRIFEEERWEIAELQIRKAIAGEVDMEAAVSRRVLAETMAHAPAIRVENSVGSHFTVVEILSENRADLLFRAAIFMARSSLEQGFVLCGTEAGKMLCVLYVRDPEGGKLEPGKGVEAFGESLKKCLAESKTGPPGSLSDEGARHLPRAG